jgi:UDP-glucose 4-epimerase
MAEMLCRQFADQFGGRVAIARSFSVYGRGLRKQLLWDACSKFHRGEAAFEGTGGEIRDWLAVDDAANLLVLACDFASAECPVVNGGTGMGVEVREVVQELAAAHGGGLVPVFNGRRRAVDPPAYIADIAQAQRLGWKPAMPWRQGVRDYVKWFLENES